MKILSKYLVLVLCFCTLHISYAQVELPPKIESTKEKLNYLLWIESEIPWLFQEGADYDIDFFNLIENQNTLKVFLESNQDYVNVARKRPSRVELEFKVVGEQAVALYDFEDEFINSLREKLEAALNANGKLNIVNDIINDIDKDFDSYYSPKGIITGLIQALPNDKKAQAFKMNDQQQIEFLTSDINLPPQDVKKKFRFENYKDIPDEMKNKKSLLKIITEGLVLEKRIFEEVVFTYMLLNDKAKNVEQQLTTNNLTLVIDALSKKTFYKESFNAHNIDIKKLRELVINYSKKFKSENKDIQSTVLSTIKLKEVPPFLGIFRGICGADCSTSFSYPYVYATHERTFFIYDENENLKGYLQATEILTEDQKTLYIHDVSGSRLSPKTVKLLIEGLVKMRKSLGYEKVALPDADRIHANSNYELIRIALGSFLTNSYKVNSSYIDSKTRVLLVKSGLKFNAEYDTEASNKVVHIINEDSLGKKIKAELNELSKEEGIFNKREISKETALFLALSLLYPTRSEDSLMALNYTYNHAGGHGSNSIEKRIKTASQIANISKIPSEHLTFINNTLKNDERLKLNDFYKGFEEILTNQKISFPDNYKSKYHTAFTYGHLNARDAASSKNKEYSDLTLKHSISLLKRWSRPAIVAEVISKNVKLFNKSKKFKSFLKSLVGIDLENLQKLEWILTLGVDSILIGADLPLLKKILSEEEDMNIVETIEKIIMKVEDGKPRKNSCRQGFSQGVSGN